MILLDTNVVSALMLPNADPAVVDALDRLPRTDVWITAVTLQEIRLGLLISPQGRKRAAREAAFATVLRRVVAGRVAPFDQASAEAAAALDAARRARGRSVEVPDTQIAGIAISRRATICTRNVRHFEDAGVPLLNPWA